MEFSWNDNEAVLVARCEPSILFPYSGAFAEICIVCWKRLDDPLHIWFCWFYIFSFLRMTTSYNIVPRNELRKFNVVYQAQIVWWQNSNLRLCKWFKFSLKFENGGFSNKYYYLKEYCEQNMPEKNKTRSEHIWFAHEEMSSSKLSHNANNKWKWNGNVQKSRWHYMYIVYM